MRLRKFFSLHSVSAVALVAVVSVALIWPTAPTAAAWWNDPKSTVLYVISWLLYFVMVKVMGVLATMATDILVYTAQLNNFTDLPVIIEAWSTVRDFANMFFIVILLVIAFGTLFGLEAYSWKKLLPKMILAAILINYSRAICGFIVDASQVVMLTFVAAIKDAATVGLTEAFSLDKLLQFGTTTTPSNAIGDTQTTSATERLLGIVAAGFMLSTLFSVQCVYFVILIGRLVMIWFLTVLSPLAYVSSVLPQTQKFSSQWWELFGRYVTVGPLMMFFLWLAMFIAARSADNGGLGTVAAGAELVSQEAENSRESGAAALDTSLLAGFIIASGMLAIGVKLANDASGELAAYTGKAAEFGKFFDLPGRMARLAPVAGAAAAGAVADRTYEKTGLDLNVSRQWQKIQHKRSDLKRKREAIGYGKAFSAAQKGDFVRGWLGAADFAYEQYTPVLGKQGMVWSHHPKKAMLTRAYGNRLYKKNMAQLKVHGDNQKAAEDTLDAKKKALGTSHMIVGERDAQLSRNTGKLQDMNMLSNNGKNWDMNKDAARTVVQSAKAKLEEQKSKETNVGKAQQIQKEIDTLDAALDKGGMVNFQWSGNMGQQLFSAKTAQTNELNAEDKRLKAISVQDDQGNALVDQDAYDTYIERATQAERQAVADAAAKTEVTQKLVTKYGPVVDYEGAQTQEAVLAEERKKYSGEENEDVLRELLQAKFDEGDGIGALGVITHSAQVGHLNEMMDKMGYEMSVEGMKKLAKDIEVKLKVDPEMVMAAMNDASKSAKHANHWAFAEAITQKNGKYAWREDSERQTRLYGEATKAGTNNIMRNGNRLALGDYKIENGKQVWRPNQAMMQLMIQALPNMQDAATKNLLNPNMGEHIFNREHGANKLNYEKVIKEAIEKTYGAGTDEATKALNALRLWKQSTHAESRKKKGMYGVSEEILKAKGSI